MLKPWDTPGSRKLTKEQSQWGLRRKANSGMIMGSGTRKSSPGSGAALVEWTVRTDWLRLCFLEQAADMKKITKWKWTGAFIKVSINEGFIKDLNSSSTSIHELMVRRGQTLMSDRRSRKQQNGSRVNFDSRQSRRRNRRQLGRAWWELSVSRTDQSKQTPEWDWT